MVKGKRLKSTNGETQLPEAMIQHIQSFLSRKEAARTTILSKSWYNAWLTRPILDFDARDFRKPSEFAEFAWKSLQRYQDLSLKIDQLKLRTLNYSKTIEPLANNLVVKAMKLGATELNLELVPNKSILPRVVLESETLVRLSLRGRSIGGNVGCWRLKSLVLRRVHLRNNDMLRNIISCCKLIEELSISDSTICKRRVDMSGVHLHELRMLKHLCLKRVVVDPLFFSDFASRFPCLKELRLANCSGHDSWIKIRSISLERISIVMQAKALTVELDVPNFVSFDYSGEGLPSLCIESSREWEFGLSIDRTKPVHSRAWFLKLKKLLTQLRPSKISLSFNITAMGRFSYRRRVDHEVGEVEVEPNPLIVENVTIKQPSSNIIVTSLANLFRICRPNFLIVDCATDKLLKIFDDDNMFGKIGLKEVSVQGYDEILAEWQPLLLLDHHFRQKIRFQLRWG